MLHSFEFMHCFYACNIVKEAGRCNSQGEVEIIRIIVSMPATSWQSLLFLRGGKKKEKKENILAVSMSY